MFSSIVIDGLFWSFSGVCSGLVMIGGPLRDCLIVTGVGYVCRCFVDGRGREVGRH